MSAPIYIGAAHPERLREEPLRRRLPGWVTLLALPVRLLEISGLMGLALTLTPLYLVGIWRWGLPPNVARWSQAARYLRALWTLQPPAPGLSLPMRLWMTLSIVRKLVVGPIWGVAWQLDEWLFGARLEATPVTAPLIEIAAGRAGTTQLARYLEDDPQLAAPSLAQFMFPYLWLWRLAGATLGRVLTPVRVHRLLERALAPEFLQRHEMDPFRTDTFEGALFLSHLNGMSFFMGPEWMVQEIHFARFAPHNQALWEQTFIDLLDRIGRKTLLAAGPGAEGPRRFFVKGHFLVAAPALERRYPDARFLCMVRDPRSRLRSAINYLRVNPSEPPLGPMPWAWLSEAVARMEVEYCEIEQAWFTQQGATRCVLRFSDYRKDLEGAMRQVYRVCLDTDELPPHVPRTHAPRPRSGYLVDRSLEELGIDEAALSERLADYIAWCG